MEPTSARDLEVDWRILAILLVDNERSALLRRTQLVLNYVGEVLALRGHFGKERVELNVEEVLLDAPSDVATTAMQVVMLMRVKGAQHRFRLRVSHEKRPVVIVADVLHRQVDVALELSRRQLEAVLRGLDIDPDTYVPSEI